MTPARPLSPWDFPPGHPGTALLTGATPQFALSTDPRFSFCLQVPRRHTPDGPPRPLVVVVHGTGRRSQALRDAFADFAERHDCVVLAPLFPAGIDGPNDVDGYKLLSPAGYRADTLLLAMAEEAAARWHIRTDRFHLHGFSGGGQFAHRFACLHPGRLASLSVGAPGRVTPFDPATPWPRGTADAKRLFGHEAAPARLREVPVQFVIGADDTRTEELAPGDEAPTVHRLARLRALRANWHDHGIASRLDTVPGTGHDHFAVLPAVRDFLAECVDDRGGRRQGRCSTGP
ncbi:alpha/beta fold hydrolase [Streptomyces sp. NPDC088674]|uniref:alpha/beta fold hydrolase n=1 Tax=Streptomyces sp. NPDC088674 TaxID=3365869 RepID=UPI0038108D53